MTPKNCYCIHTFIHDYPAGLGLPQRTTNCGGEWSDLALSQADSIHMDSTLAYKDKYRIEFQNPIQKASWTAAQQFYSLNLQQVNKQRLLFYVSVVFLWPSHNADADCSHKVCNQDAEPGLPREGGEEVKKPGLFRNDIFAEEDTDSGLHVRFCHSHCLLTGSSEREGSHGEISFLWTKYTEGLTLPKD